MSKKRFTEGLESLFADTPEEADRRTSLPADARKDDKPGKEHSGKDFSSDLHAFLQNAFEESFEEKLNERRKESAPKKSRRPSSSGLDALIRNTLEPSTMRIDPKATRRLVVTFREEQLDKLKNIARREKTYLKEIISEIVEAYIQQYEQGQSDKSI